MSTKEKTLRILLATPLGYQGHGGIDRLNDMIIDQVKELSTDISIRRLVTRGNGSVICAPFFLLWSLFRLWLAAGRKEVDLLHIAVALKGSLYRKLILSRWAKYCGVPYILHEHGAGFDKDWPNMPPRLAAATDRMFNESIAVVVLSRAWMRFISRRLPACANKVILIPNGTPAVPPVAKSSQKDAVQITFLGELGPRKGTPQLVEALGRLGDEKRWVATIAGNRDVEMTKTRVGELGIAHRVVVPGWLDPNQTEELLRHTDIFVLPSFREVLPMSILEAMSHELAIITTPVGAIPEAIEDQRTGLLVPPGDVATLTAALAGLIADPQARARLGSAARQEHMERFEITVCVVRLIKLWRRLASNGKR